MPATPTGSTAGRGIQTSFVKRGRPSFVKKDNDIIRNELARVRATRMAGSFGTQKEHYGLKRIKARTKQTESLYIFFGIHTANVVQLVRREANEIAQAAWHSRYVRVSNGPFTGVMAPVVSENEIIRPETEPKI